MENKTLAWAVTFSPELLETTTMKDNEKIWHPLAIFESLTEAINYREEKWMGKQTNDGDIKVTEVEITW